MKKQTKIKKAMKRPVSPVTLVESASAVSAIPRAQHSNVLIAWTSPSFQKHEKGIAWYIIAALLLGGILWYSLMSGSWSTALVFLLFAGVYLMNSRHEPMDAVTAITDLGIQHGRKFFSYGEIKGYWLAYKPPQVKVLHIRLSGRKGEVEIDLNDQSPAEVRAILSREIPEIEGKGEPFVNYVTRILKL